MSEADVTMRAVNKLIDVIADMYKDSNIRETKNDYVELGSSLVKLLRRRAEISELRAQKIVLLEKRIKQLESKEKLPEKKNYGTSMAVISQDYKTGGQDD